jgi:hypothetical protein
LLNVVLLSVVMLNVVAPSQMILQVRYHVQGFTHRK